MRTSSINPSDLLTIKGTYSGRIELPKVPGFEGVGIVVDIGNQQNDFLLRKLVLAIRGIGSWQEYNLIPSENIILVPEQIDNNTAA
jgi:NADPH:quinone reductase-like Zn-dependent oxidoreductase